MRALPPDVSGIVAQARPHRAAPGRHRIEPTLLSTEHTTSPSVEEAERMRRRRPDRVAIAKLRGRGGRTSVNARREAGSSQHGARGRMSTTVEHFLCRSHEPGMPSGRRNSAAATRSRLAPPLEAPKRGSALRSPWASRGDGCQGAGGTFGSSRLARGRALRRARAHRASRHRGGLGGRSWRAGRFGKRTDGGASTAAARIFRVREEEGHDHPRATSKPARRSWTVRCSSPQRIARGAARCLDDVRAG